MSLIRRPRLFQYYFELVLILYSSTDNVIKKYQSAIELLYIAAEGKYTGFNIGSTLVGDLLGFISKNDIKDVS